eukprot:15042128-Ditylum_brightwellii.AAC.1
MWMILTKQWHDLLLGHYLMLAGVHDLLLGHYLVSAGYYSVSDPFEGSPTSCSDFPDYGVLVHRNL